MEEENGIDKQELLCGKFKSVDALVKAYEALEAEFTRRSQRLKDPAGSKAAEPPKEEKAAAPSADGREQGGAREDESEALLAAALRNESVRAKIVGEYLRSLKGVPLLAGAGRSVAAPADRPKSFAEAGALALGYLKSKP